MSQIQPIEPNLRQYFHCRVWKSLEIGLPFFISELWCVMVNIKDIQGNILLSTPINEGSKRKFTLQKEDYITLKFSVDNPVYFKLGYGIDDNTLPYPYELIDVENWKPSYNEKNGGYDYELRLDAYYWKWKNKIFKYTPENGGKEASWNLTATLDVHLGIYLRNLTSLGYTFRGTAFEFSIDSTVENSAKLVSYDNTNMIDGLTTMAEAWECEWWVTDNIIHFGRCEFGDPMDFEIGVNVTNMSRSSSQTDYATRIIAFGSTRNIPTNYRPVDEQIIVNGVVQRRLMLPVGTPYVDAFEGMSQEEAVEDIVVFDDIYPKFVGTIAEITQTTGNYVDENNDPTGETYPVYTFKDTSLKNFKKEYLLKELRLGFQSGSLNGLDFALTLKSSDDTGTTFEVVRNNDYGRDLPDDTLKPTVGSTYALYGFDPSCISNEMLPAAEQELKERTEAYVAKTKIDPSTYDCKMSSIYMHNDGDSRTFEVGDRVNLINKGYFKDGRVSRIIGFEYNLDYPYDNPTYTIGETASYSRLSDIEQKVDAVTYKGQTYTGSGGSGVYVIRTNDNTTASNSNVFSALRQLAMFIRKDIPDIVKEKITFAKGLIFGDFKSGESGGAITGAGAGELKSLHVRESVRSDNVEANTASVKEMSVSDQTTTLNLLVQQLAKTHDLDVSNVATLFRTIVKDYVSSETFVSGITGEGMKLYKALNGDWNLELDNVTIRKAMTVFELIISKIRSVNGGLVVSQGNGRIKSVAETTGTPAYYVLGIEGDMTFQADDFVRCQVFSPSGAKYYWVQVDSVSGNSIVVLKSEFPEGTVPAVGDDLVQMGNKTNTARQGVLYLTASEDGKPRFSVLDGVNSTDLTGKNKVILGCLDGITDSDFPSDAQPSGYGLWAANVFLKGLFILRNGKSIEDELNDQITAVQTAFEIREGQISSKVTQATAAAQTATNKAGEAAASAGTASSKASAAADSENTAGQKATAASNSAAAASGSAKAAKDSADNASEILSQVTTKQSSIDQTADHIATQVKEVNTKATAAADSASAAASSASNAAGSASQASGVLVAVTQKETNINQTASDINLKATRAESAAGRAESAEANINVKADGVVVQAASSAAQKAVDGVQVGGSNLLQNGDFSTYAINNSIGWNNALNGTYFMSSWGSGYNPGVTSPTVGYHAHLNIAKFGFPVLEYINKNSVYGLAHRWMGVASGVYNKEKLLPGQRYTFSADVMIDTAGMCIHGGVYSKKTSGASYNFYSGSYTLAPSSTNVWQRVSYTFVLDKDIDLSGGVLFYIYGHAGTEGIAWVKNVSLQLGTKGSFVRCDGDVNTDAQARANTAEKNAKNYVNDNFTTKNEYSSKLKVLSDQISSKVSQTTFDSLSRTVNTHTTAITQLPTTIDARITSQTQDGGTIKTKVESWFSMVGNMLSMGAKQINISGATIFSSTATKDEVTTSINKMEVSTRNLFRMSDLSDDDAGYSTHAHILVRATLNRRNLTIAPIKEAGWYSLSYRIKVENHTGSNFTMIPNINDSPVAAYTGGNTSGWKLMKGSVYVGNYIGIHGFIDWEYDNPYATVYISDVVITKGTKPLQNYIESPEEVNATIVGAQNAATTNARDNLATRLGYANYADMEAQAIAGKSIINGGMIRTTLINADAIITSSLLASKIKTTDITTGKLTVTTGAKIGGFAINGSMLTGSSDGVNLRLAPEYIYFKDSYHNNTVMIGGDTIPGIGGGAFSCPASFSSQRIITNTSQGIGNIALMLSATGAAHWDNYVESGNTALHISNGHITGFRLNCRIINTSQTLSKMDNMIITERDSGDITLTLPSDAERGQMLFIRKDGNSRVWIKGSYIVNDGDWIRERSTSVQLNRAGLGILMFNGTYWTWNNMNG